MARGRTQVIAKVEHQTADEGFDGALTGGRREDDGAVLFAEHGLTDRLTLQAKGGWTRGRDGADRYEGRGPLEVGVRYAFVRRERTVAAVAFVAAEGGSGRNAGYARPGAGTTDLEVRLLIGRSLAVRGVETFVDVQAARLRRGGLDDETRLDATVGMRPGPGWLLLTQTYAGQTDSKALEARWLKGEVSVVRALGQVQVQLGWRQALAGRGVAKDRGPVIAVWRGF